MRKLRQFFKKCVFSKLRVEIDKVIIYNVDTGGAYDQIYIRRKRHR